MTTSLLVLHRHPKLSISDFACSSNSIIEQSKLLPLIIKMGFEVGV